MSGGTDDGLAASRRRALRRRLLDWYARHRRDLPWRRTRDPYRIWLSEAMLQQTRVETVIPYYERFVSRFPDVHALADADEQDVLKAWEGLGYYSRARNLKRAAERVVDRHDGQLPRDPDALRALPGIGPYTAGAIRSIAFDQPAALVDGNVRRVLCRWLASEQLDDGRAWELAQALVEGPDPGAFNQALMELGATVCTPRSPRCDACPVASLCAGRETGRPADFPAPRRRAAPPDVRAIAGVLRARNGRWLMLRRPSRGLLGGLWETPSAAGDSAQHLVDELRERTGIEAAAGPELGEVRHVFTHRALTLRAIELAHGGGRLRADRAGDEARWCTRAEVDALPLSRLVRKLIALVDGAGDAMPGRAKRPGPSRGSPSRRPQRERGA